MALQYTLAGIAVFLVAGGILTILGGGIIACAECACCKLGIKRFAGIMAH
jgi:hypothetical protein